MGKSAHKKREYLLGHSTQELARLAKQAEFYRELTRNLLICAGIAPGMRVLDFGTGAGDVALLLSELVGESGEVIAVDRAPEALERAQYRLSELGIKNVRIVAGDDNSLPGMFANQPVDAAVGRLVLLHQADPLAVFSKILECVRPGGIVVFQEIDGESQVWTKPALPLMSQVYGWISRTLLEAGTPGDIGATLVRAFDQADIQGRHIAREGMLESGPQAMGYDYYADVIQTLLPLMEKIKVATAAEVQLDTLAARLREEAVSRQAIFIPIFFIGAYGRKPG